MAIGWGRRQSTVRWTSSDEGLASEAVTESEAWLSARPVDAGWEPVLGGLRDALVRLTMDPRIAGDPEARRLLGELAAVAEEPEALADALEALRRRAAELVGAGDEPRPEAGDHMVRSMRTVLRI